MSDKPSDVEIEEAKDLLGPVNTKEEVRRLEKMLDGARDGSGVEEIDPYTEFEGNHVGNIIKSSVTKTDRVKSKNELGAEFIENGWDHDTISEVVLYKCICGEEFDSKEELDNHLSKNAVAKKRDQRMF